MFTSQKFSQQLKEAGFEGESEMYFVQGMEIGEKNGEDYEMWNAENYVEMVTKEKANAVLKYKQGEDEKEVADTVNVYPTFDIIYDLCITYAREVWGETIVGKGWGNVTYRTQEILSMLQQGKSQDGIEDYIRTHSVLFNNQP